MVLNHDLRTTRAKESLAYTVEMQDMAPNTRRLLRLAGAILWMTSGAPTLLVLSGIHGALGVTDAATWLGGFIVFGIAFWRVTAVLETARPEPRVVGLLVIQSIAALTMFHIVCTGFESALLVLVAALLGMAVPFAAAMPWVLGQTLAMSYLGTFHWTVGRSVWFAANALGLQVVGLLVANFAANEARARHALARANAELRAARSLLAHSSRAAERVRISRDLHDIMGHHLAGLSLHLEVASHVAGEAARESLGRAQRVTKQILHDVRGVVSALREEPTVDLRAALLALVADIERPLIHIDVPADLELDDPQLAHTLVCCAQEIVTNATRHARAQNIWIEVALDDAGLMLKACDDGCAAEPIAAGNGLRGMRERIEAVGGRLDYGAGRGKGFWIAASLPMPEGVAR